MEARRSLLLACCLALASSFTPHLEALETLEETQMLRYACIDDKGRTTCIIEMLVRPNPAGGIEIISTDSMGRREYARLNAAMLQKENAWLDDRSLFFILPAILDPKIIGGEARFVLVRTEGGQRAAMRLRAEGVAEVTDYTGHFAYHPDRRRYYEE